MTNFPFGYGLTYTSFAYRAIQLYPGLYVPVGEDLQVHVTIGNVGTRRGKEVVQVYVDPWDAGGPRGRELHAFTKVALLPGEIATVRLQVPASVFAQGDDRTALQASIGRFEVFVGPSVSDVPLHETVRVYKPEKDKSSPGKVVQAPTGDEELLQGGGEEHQQDCRVE